MLKSILKLNGVNALEKAQQGTIRGGAAYLCWNGKGNFYDSEDDISQYVPGGGPLEQIYCIPTS
jgi:hypothetical protein